MPEAYWQEYIFRKSHKKQKSAKKIDHNTSPMSSVNLSGLQTNPIFKQLVIPRTQPG